MGPLRLKDLILVSFLGVFQFLIASSILQDGGHICHPSLLASHDRG